MILITGASGMLGSHVLYQLCLTDNKIRAIKRENSNIEVVLKVFSFYSDQPKRLLSKVEWVNADLLDEHQLDSAFSGVKKVYHCAAKISFSKKHENILFQTNVEGTKNIVDLCLHHGIEKLCHVSSVAAIGKTLDGGEATEQTLWADSPENSSYAMSKYQGELEIWRGIEEGLNAVIVNPSVILGPGNWDKSSARMFDLVWKGLRFYTPGGTGFVDVKDVAYLMIDLMESKVTSERFIISSENLSYKQVLGHIADSLSKPKPRWIANRFIMILAYGIQNFMTFFSGKEAQLSKELLKSGTKKTSYSNKKILESIPFSFQLIHQSCQEVSTRFIKDHS